jgi:hypothetical protein
MSKDLLRTPIIINALSIEESEVCQKCAAPLHGIDRQLPLGASSLLQIALGKEFLQLKLVSWIQAHAARHDLRLGRDVRHGLRLPIVSAFQELAEAEGVLCG